MRERLSIDGHLPSACSPDLRAFIGGETWPAEESPEVGAGDAATRAVVAAWLFHTAQAQLKSYGSTASPFELESIGLGRCAIDKAYILSLDPLRRHLDHLPVAHVQPEHRLWELHAAGLAQHGPRVRTLCEHMAAADPSPTTVAICARAAFLVDDSVAELLPLDGRVPVWWDAAVVDQWSEIFCGLAVALPGRELRATLYGDEPLQFNSPDEATARRIRTWLETMAQVRELLPEEHAILGWAGFVMAIAGDGLAAAYAGERFTAAANDIRFVPFQTGLGSAAAACFALGGRIDRAEDGLRRRAAMGMFSNMPAAILDLAVCLGQQGKTEEQAQVVRNYELLQMLNAAAGVSTDSEGAEGTSPP